MRLGFTITHQNPNSSQNSGQNSVIFAKEDKVGYISRIGHDIGAFFWVLNAFFY
jgi:hypothetical protein